MADRATEPGPGRRPGELTLARAAALDLAPAHLDADRAGPAAPAGAGRDPGLGDPAGRASTRSRPRSGRTTIPTLTPIYERLGLFDVYGSPWFAAIYLLLMVSLVGCFVPADRGLRAGAARPAARDPAPPRPAARPRVVRAPTSRRDEVLDRARTLLARLPGPARTTAPTRSPPSAATSARPATCSSTCRCWSCWSASAIGSLFGYRGGVIVVVGNGMSQQPHPVRRLPARAACSARRTSTTSTSTSTTSTSSGSTERPAAGPGAQVRLPRDLRRGGRRAAGVRPAGQPPAVDRRHRRLPDRPRLRPGHHGPRRQRRRRLQRPDRSSCPRTSRSSRSAWSRRPTRGPSRSGSRAGSYPTYAFTDETGPFSVFGEAEQPA